MRKDSQTTPQPLARASTPSVLGGVLQSLPAETPLSEIELARVKTRLEITLSKAGGVQGRATNRSRFSFGLHRSLGFRFATAVLLVVLGASAGAAGTFVVMKLVVAEARVSPGRSPVVPSRPPKPYVRKKAAPAEEPVQTSTEDSLAAPANEAPPTPLPPQRKLTGRLVKPVEAPVVSVAPQAMQDDETAQQARLVGAALASLARPSEHAAALSQLHHYVALYPHGVFAQEAKIAIITAFARNDRQDEALQALEAAPDVTADNIDLSLLQAELLVKKDCGRARGIFARDQQRVLTPAQSERADFGYARALQACGRHTELVDALKQYRERHPQGARIATVTQWLEQQEGVSPRKSL